MMAAPGVRLIQIGNRLDRNNSIGTGNGKLNKKSRWGCISSPGWRVWDICTGSLKNIISPIMEHVKQIGWYQKKPPMNTRKHRGSGRKNEKSISAFFITIGTGGENFNKKIQVTSEIEGNWDRWRHLERLELQKPRGKFGFRDSVYQLWKRYVKLIWWYEKMVSPNCRQALLNAPNSKKMLRGVQIGRFTNNRGDLL